ncbi:hypothetical protein [Streptobacillus notomytis]|uniref:hypothetical protein n=1 Tax=Streptobacillus notomytis TaxID=1712031 RepID=UPI0009358A7E|nr:hypothetical protein [Streptobacillus notomytis]
MKKVLFTFLIFFNLLSFSSTSKERYRIEGTLAYGRKFADDNNSSAFNELDISAGVMVEWKYGILEKLDLTFGPKVSLSGQFNKDNSRIVGGGSLNLTLTGEINYLIHKNIKLYSGSELGLGLSIRYKNSINVKLEPLAKQSFGIKIVDRYNVALFAGYGNKGMAGIEAGYTF